MLENDTIAAIATPIGIGGVAILRISGKQALNISYKLIKIQLSPRRATFAKFYELNGNVLDHGIAIYFQAPNSFTGEDIVEFHGHGGITISNMLLQLVISLGARLAEPGEFSMRAFLNNKIDLLQAEAIADLIHAKSQQAARAAIRSLTGAFSLRVQQLQKLLIDLRMQVEALLDFSEEDLPINSDNFIIQVDNLLIMVQEILLQSEQGVKLSSGIKIAIIGAPNVGKSSLLNKLSAQDKAIVTDMPGTTRDLIEVEVVYAGCLFNFIDTAGLRYSDDIIEQEGIKRTRKCIAQADVLLLLSVATEDNSDINQFIDINDIIYNQHKQVIYVINKIDLLSMASKKVEAYDNIHIYLSAYTGDGVELLLQTIKNLTFSALDQNEFVARLRHVLSLQKILQGLQVARSLLNSSGFLDQVAEELLIVQKLLSELTGEFASEDLLAKIFGEFCIGK